MIERQNQIVACVTETTRQGIYPVMKNSITVGTAFIFIAGMIVCCLSISVAVADEAASAARSVLTSLPERRKEQFQTSFGYALFPYPYNIPGIGGGIGLVGGAMNIGHTYTDAYGIVYSGDVESMAAGVEDIHLVPQRLV